MQGHSQNSGMVNNQMPGQQSHYAMNAQQPAHKHKHAQSGSQEWNNSLFGCLSDLGSCCLTWWCPCVQYGKNYEKINDGGCCSRGALFCLLAPFGLSCCIHKELRADVRRRYGIQEGCSDCLVTCFCTGCAIAQEARELKDRG